MYVYCVILCEILWKPHLLDYRASLRSVVDFGFVLTFFSVFSREKIRGEAG